MIPCDICKDIDRKPKNIYLTMTSIEQAMPKMDQTVININQPKRNMNKINTNIGQHISNIDPTMKCLGKNTELLPTRKINSLIFLKEDWKFQKFQYFF